jgi:hypothetical protein
MPRNDLKAYTTVLARLPQDLADQVKRYAQVHRCTVSELIRDGLEMRLEAVDVPGRSTRHPGETGDSVFPEVLQGITEVLQAVKALSPMGQAAIRQTMSEVLHEVLPEYVSRQQDQEKGITEVLPIIPTILQPAPEGVPGHTALPQPDTHTMPSLVPLEAHLPGDEQGGDTEVLQGMTEVLPHESQEAPRHSRDMTKVFPHEAPGARTHQEGMTAVVHDHAAFDATRFVLGKLCPRGHAYQGTGKSLLTRASRHCPQCDTEQARERRARQKATAREG